MGSELHVGIDVGCRRHRIAVGDSEGHIVDEFDVSHDGPGIAEFFKRIDGLAGEVQVAVAMEGYNGWARPLDRLILAHGWHLYNVNNLKLARYKEIFPAPAKTDAIDARRIVELFSARKTLNVARDVLQWVGVPSAENDKLKRLTRRRRQLVQEKVHIAVRMHSDLQAICPGLLTITGDVENQWFLNLLTAREDIRQLARMHRSSLLKLHGVGKVYLRCIVDWQWQACFSDEAEWVGPMVIRDARRLLALKHEITEIEALIEPIAANSTLARHIDSIPGFALICCSELAGEIGTIDRFAHESGLALYLGMAALDNSSGKHVGSRPSRQVNTRARAAMMTAVARHIDHVPCSKAYYDKKRAQGKTHNQAVRAVGRQLVRVMWSMLKHDRDYRIE